MTGIVTESLTRRAMMRRAAQLGFMGAAAPLAIELASAGEAAALASSGDDYRALVCVFLYGGNDHGNTLVPYDRPNHARYAKIRGSVAFQRELLRDTVLKPRATQTLTDDQQFALAPYCPGLKKLFDNGKAAVQLNVGALVTPLTLAQYESPDRAKYPLPPKLFSHNDQQSFWQALGSEGSTVGWGGRLGDMALSGNDQALLTCISASGNAVFVSGRDALQYQISPEGAIPFRPIKHLPWSTPAVSAALEQLVTRPSRHAFENELALLARRSMAMEGVVNGALDKVAVPAPFVPVPEANSLAGQLAI
ncbi:MAG TPA: Tat pathway signal protein, partial [Croceibacterium sp.]